MNPAFAAFNARKKPLLAAMAVLACLVLWEHDRELVDADVRRLYGDCDDPNSPPGLQMPSMPSEHQRFWTRQHWTDSGELKVEVWEFHEPGNRLISANRYVQGNHIVIEPRWVIPMFGSAAACYEKFGIEVTFHGLARREYAIDPK